MVCFLILWITCMSFSLIPSPIPCMKPGNETRIVPLLFTAEHQILYYTTLIPKPRPPFSCLQHIKAHVSTRSPPTLLYFKSQKTGRGLWMRVEVVGFLDRVAQLPHPMLIMLQATEVVRLGCCYWDVTASSYPSSLSPFFWGGAWLVWGCTLL